MIVSPYGFVNLFGVLFLFLIPFILLSSRPVQDKQSELDSHQREKIISYAALMWEFYRDFCTPIENFLPPDNMQETPSRLFVIGG